MRHNHFYDFTPVAQNIVTPDYKSYKVTSIGTPYKQGTLRVYVNGIRLSESNLVYIPFNFTVSGPSWKLMGYTEDVADVNGIVTSGKFTLSSTITASDIIRVDFDTQFS